MNLFKTIYCNQYFELEPKGKAHEAQKMGTILSTIVLVLFMLSLFFISITFFPDFEKEMDRFFKKLFGRTSGRFIGKLVGLLLFVASYPIIRFTVGAASSYKKTIARFNLKSQKEKEQISKKGLWFFMSAVITVLIILFMVAIKLNFFD